ncbi:hypothetical protein BKA15_001103 [Microlunatus parietis]|uniref:Uncharacterized protein n=1 Tax=Microlunatus parietis TaxID=682979 RepID=A0A7Y9I3X7_9ACTN|nr:hypothetical protein [Microlunatus parietis]
MLTFRVDRARTGTRLRRGVGRIGESPAGQTRRNIPQPLSRLGSTSANRRPHSSYSMSCAAPHSRTRSGSGTRAALFAARALIAALFLRLRAAPRGLASPFRGLGAAPSRLRPCGAGTSWPCLARLRFRGSGPWRGTSRSWRVPSSSWFDPSRLRPFAAPALAQPRFLRWARPSWACLATLRCAVPSAAPILPPRRCFGPRSLGAAGSGSVSRRNCSRPVPSAPPPRAQSLRGRWFFALRLLLRPFAPTGHFCSDTPTKRLLL